MTESDNASELRVAMRRHRMGGRSPTCLCVIVSVPRREQSARGILNSKSEQQIVFATGLKE